MRTRPYDFLTVFFLLIQPERGASSGEQPDTDTVEQDTSLKEISFQNMSRIGAHLTNVDAQVEPHNLRRTPTETMMSIAGKVDFVPVPAGRHCSNFCSA